MSTLYYPLERAQQFIEHDDTCSETCSDNSSSDLRASSEDLEEGAWWPHGAHNAPDTKLQRVVNELNMPHFDVQEARRFLRAVNERHDDGQDGLLFHGDILT